MNKLYSILISTWFVSIDQLGSMQLGFFSMLFHYQFWHIFTSKLIPTCYSPDFDIFRFWLNFHIQHSINFNTLLVRYFTSVSSCALKSILKSFLTQNLIWHIFFPQIRIWHIFQYNIDSNLFPNKYSSLTCLQSEIISNKFFNLKINSDSFWLLQSILTNFLIFIFYFEKIALFHHLT